MVLSLPRALGALLLALLAVPSQAEATTPPPAAPTLTAPADAADLNATAPSTVTFTWTAVSEADAYALELSATADFSGTVVTIPSTSPSATVQAADLPPNVNTTYWRVTASNADGVGDPSAVWQFAYQTYLPAFASFEVIANASGPLPTPVAGAAAFQDFPTPGATNPDGQQANGTRWLIASGGVGPFAEFVERALRNDDADRFHPFDYEIRFTGTSLANKDGFGNQTGAAVELPFEIWNIGSGTPADPSDDVRLIPYIFDLDDDGTFNLSTQDSPISGAENDPETDWIYWHEPIDMTPGEAGYFAYANGGTPDVSKVGGEVLARQTFVGWNLGPAPYAAAAPEPGTVFRILTTNPVTDPTRNTAVATSPSGAVTLDGAAPNPVTGTSAVPFTLATAANARLALVDLLGREVAVLADGPLAAGPHQARVEADGLAAGVYILVLDAQGERVTRSVTIVR